MKDYHPLMNPFEIPEFPDGQGDAEPFPTVLLAVTIAVLTVFGLVLLAYVKKRNPKTGDRT